MKYTKFTTLSTTLLFTLLVSISSAQVTGGTQQKLFDMYVMGEYEKCADRALKMTENDNTKAESEPYLYYAMCMIKLGDDPEMREYYPNAIKDALKFGVKFKKRDDKLKSKEKEYLFDQNTEFIDELKEIAVREAKGFFVQNDFRKSVAFYKMGHQMDEADLAMKFMYGVSEVYAKNTKVGMTLINEALESFRNLAKGSGYKVNPMTQTAFEDAFFYFVEHNKSSGNSTEAKELVKLARELAPDNKRFKDMAKKL